MNEVVQFIIIFVMLVWCIFSAVLLAKDFFRTDNMSDALGTSFMLVCVIILAAQLFVIVQKINSEVGVGL
jgi:hypothetical protein